MGIHGANEHSFQEVLKQTQNSGQRWKEALGIWWAHGVLATGVAEGIKVKGSGKRTEDTE